jgi:hypothetical protein
MNFIKKDVMDTGKYVCMYLQMESKEKKIDY